MINKERNLKITFYWLTAVFIILTIINAAMSAAKYETFNNHESVIYAAKSVGSFIFIIIFRFMAFGKKSILYQEHYSKIVILGIILSAVFIIALIAITTELYISLFISCIINKILNKTKIDFKLTEKPVVESLKIAAILSVISISFIGLLVLLIASAYGLANGA